MGKADMKIKSLSPELSQQPPKPRTNRFNTLLAAVVLSLTALYCTSGPFDDSLDARFEFNVTKKLPDVTYALCSPEGSKESVYTVDEKDSQVECVLVHEDTIVETGRLERLKGLYGRLGQSEELDVVRIPEGAIVVPGLTDSHCHILEYGFSRQIPLEGAKNVQEAVNAVAEYVKSNPDILNDPTRVIEGWGWDHEGWDVPKLPTAADLSSHPLLANRQIILASKDGHASWVSATTLTLNAPYPSQIEGGVIVRDKQTGEPTGVFKDTAQDLITPAPVTEKQQLERFKNTVRDALSVGLTSLHDAGAHAESLEFFTRQSERKGGLPIRVYAMTFFNASAISASSSDLSGYWGHKTAKINELSGKRKFSSRSVKIFGDGALRTAGAALYEPYSDDPTTLGQMRYTPEVLNRVIPKFLKDGWQVNVHAIGDRANGVVLDAFEVAATEMGLKTFEGSAVRPRLEHAQVIAKRDIERVARLGVIASVQPTHAISDMWYGQDRLGAERVKQLYPFQSLLRAGARLTLGSDFPVEGVNPLAGFYAAITRLSVEGTSPHGRGGWFPNERLTRTQALRGMTIEPAYASFTENILGSLEPGKKADFVVLERDVMRVGVEEVLETRVLATVVDGRVVFGGI